MISLTCIMISATVLNTPMVLKIIPTVLMISPMVLNTPTVLKISPTFIMISPMVLNTPTVLKISPTVLMISPTVLNTPMVLRPPRYCTHIIQGDDDYRPVLPTITYKPNPAPRTNKKPVPKPRKSAKQIVNEYFIDFILPPPTQFRDGYKQIQRPPLPPMAPQQLKCRPIPKPSTDWLSNFDYEILQTRNGSLRKFEIVSTLSVQNKKFKSYTNEFKVKILKKLHGVDNIYSIFQELIRTVKKKRKLDGNDRLRFVTQNKELTNVISTKFNKVKLGDLEQAIKTLEYKDTPLQKCKITIQRVKIPKALDAYICRKIRWKGKKCIITIKNDDSICLAHLIATARKMDKNTNSRRF